MGRLSVPAVPRTSWAGPSRARVDGVRAALRREYGRVVLEPHGDPLAELVLTILSQSTNDRNRDVAYLRLVERLPSWEAVRAAPVEEVEEAIRPGGISRVKSARIKDVLDAIAAAQGGSLDLGWMARPRRRDVLRARRFLCDLPGVGRKTAACVLLFSFGVRDVPVDTHVSRVATRLGWLRPGAPLDPEQHDAFLALTPRGAELELHVGLLRHGRRVCTAQRPRCGECALRRRCAQVGVERPA